MHRVLALLVLASAAPTLAQPGATFDPDTVRAAPLDGGKMWLFEDPPTEYLDETYGFTPDAEWFDRARLAALRMRGCSASFVSPSGLVATNHHCAQSSVVSVDEGGEGLLDAGFAARSRAEERRVDGMYMDQLVAIEDVTAEMQAALEDAGDDAPADSVLELAQAAAEERIRVALASAGDDPDDFAIEIVGLYDGGKYSAYTFRRFTDVRLVFAPEQRLGYFGGDYDNFTYPRYALDFAFFRVYGDDGQPLANEHFFPLADDGVSEGDLVFVIGNPGRTDRARTVAELEYLRDVDLPSRLAFIDSRAAALRRYLDSGEPDNPDAVRSQLFSLLNGQKATNGRLDGLRDPYIIARRRAAEQDFVGAIAGAGGMVEEMEGIQAEKRALASSSGLRYLFNGRYGSALMRRALRVVQGDDPTAVEARPAALEEAFLADEIATLQTFYRGDASRPMPKNLQAEPLDAARFLLANSSLAGDAPSANPGGGDPVVLLVREVLPALQMSGQALRALGTRESDLARRLGQARYAAYGNTVPPDATFSPRFTDGVVKGYPYNGTEAPPVTTLYGLYDRHYSFCVAGATDDAAPCDWELPDHWVNAAGRVDLATPVNFTSTSDTIGGNSGSPVVNRDLELVGLNFDRTIEGLVRDYLYAPERGRNVMVDARVILEALRNVYGLPALADEISGE